MNGREQILNEISATHSVIPPLEYSVVPVVYDAPMEQFNKVLGNIGGKCITVTDETELQQLLSVDFPEAVWAVQCKAYSNEQCFQATSVICRGTVAVAENAAIWVSDANMGNRLLPFSCTHLILVVSAENIVSNMHQAYTVLKDQAINFGYGVFIAGPSKTADIEQSLVIGAHGPLELLVIIIKPNHD